MTRKSGAWKDAEAKGRRNPVLLVIGRSYVYGWKAKEKEPVDQTCIKHSDRSDHSKRNRFLLLLI